MPFCPRERTAPIAIGPAITTTSSYAIALAPCTHRTGALHPLNADVGCRNTLYNDVPQTAAEYLPRLVTRGARHLRIEFLDEDASAVRRIVGLYQDALTGRGDAHTLWRELKASNQYGATRGPLNVL